MAETPKIILPEKMNTTAEDAARANLRQAAQQAREGLANIDSAKAAQEEAARVARASETAEAADRAGKGVAERAAAERAAAEQAKPKGLVERAKSAVGIKKPEITPEAANGRIAAAAEEGKAAIEAAKNSKNIQIANGVAEGPKHSREFLEQASKQARAELDAMKAAKPVGAPPVNTTTAAAEAADKATARITEKAAAERAAAKPEAPKVKTPTTPGRAMVGGAGIGAVAGAVGTAMNGGSAGDVAQSATTNASAGAVAGQVFARTPGHVAVKVIAAAVAGGAVALGVDKALNKLFSSEPASAEPVPPVAQPASAPAVAPVPAPVASAASAPAPASGAAPAPVPASGAASSAAAAASAPAPAAPAANQTYEQALEKFGTQAIILQRGGAVPADELDAAKNALIKLNGSKNAAQSADEWKEYFARKSAQDPFKTMEPAAAAKAIIVYDKGQQAARTTTPAPAAPAPATPAPAAPAATAGVIIVKEGDSLSKIAMKDPQMKAVREAVEKAFNGKADPLTVALITSMAMAEANGIKKPDHIEAGWKIDVAKTLAKLPEVVTKMRNHLAMLDDNTPGQITKDEFKGLQSGVPNLQGKTTQDILNAR